MRQVRKFYMTVFLIVWVCSLVLVLGLLVRGYARLRVIPASYELHSGVPSRLGFVIFQTLQYVGVWIKDQTRQLLHHVFHFAFHALKRAHDRIFGKQPVIEDRPASFFLKSIVEHKEEQSKERPRG